MSAAKKSRVKGTAFGVPRHGDPQQIAVAGTAVAEVLRRIEEVDAGRVSRRRLQLVDLTPTSCRWPVGEPGTPEFYFCGEDAPKQPYCTYHANVAFKHQP